MKYLLEIFSFILIGLVIFILLFNVAEKYDSQINFRIRTLFEKADSIEALAIGNSHACAIDFNELRLNGFRIARGGNDIFEAVYQIKALIPKLPELKIVFFNISYFSLFSDNSAIPDYYAFFNTSEYKNLLEHFPGASAYLDTTVYSGYIVINTNELSSLQKTKLGPALDVIMGYTADRLKIRWSDYNSFSSLNWVRGDFLNFIQNRIAIVARTDHWHDIISQIIRGKNPPIKYTGIDSFGQFDDTLRNSYKNPDSLLSLAKDYIAPMYLCNQQIVVENNGDILEENYESLISIIDYLKSRGIRIVFYSSPVYKSFSDYYDKSTIKIMKETMQRLAEENNVEYYDFSSDSSFSDNYKLFYNSDHLNRFGAAEFSKKFRDVIEASGELYLTKNKNN